MLHLTNRHCRVWLRLFSPRSKLYSEMVVADSIAGRGRQRLPELDTSEHPVVLQLGGSEPQTLAAAARLGAARGYDEINLNVGCPSHRVHNAQFGACLMATPPRVADCVAAMRAQVTMPVTVKTRIGIDALDSYDHLADFISTVAAAGCRYFIVHARKAWLKGVSPKQNRTLPPLQYARVYRLKADFPQLQFEINGGITTIPEITAHLTAVDAVMLGRAAYHNPYFLTALDQHFFPTAHHALSRIELATAYLPYIERQLARGVSLNSMTRPMLGLFHGQPGARGWRRDLGEYRAEDKSQVRGLEVVERAITRAQRRHFPRAGATVRVADGVDGGVDHGTYVRPLNVEPMRAPLTTHF